jgi:hypothetical protein
LSMPARLLHLRSNQRTALYALAASANCAYQAQNRSGWALRRISWGQRLLRRAPRSRVRVQPSAL